MKFVLKKLRILLPLLCIWLMPAFPRLGLRVSPLDETAPKIEGSKYSSYSLPNPKVPEAAITGFFI